MCEFKSEFHSWANSPTFNWFRKVFFFVLLKRSTINHGILKWYYHYCVFNIQAVSALNEKKRLFFLFSWNGVTLFQIQSINIWPCSWYLDLIIIYQKWNGAQSPYLFMVRAIFTIENIRNFATENNIKKIHATKAEIKSFYNISCKWTAKILFGRFFSCAFVLWIEGNRNKCNGFGSLVNSKLKISSSWKYFNKTYSSVSTWKRIHSANISTDSKKGKRKRLWHQHIYMRIGNWV